MNVSSFPVLSVLRKVGDETVSSGLSVSDLGSRKDVRRQAIKDEQERLEAEMRSNAYQSAYAKADEASKLLRLEQTLNVKTEEDETPVFVDDDEDLRKSLEKARRLALKKEGEGASCPQAIALLATSNHNNETDNQNPTAGESRENKVVFTEMVLLVGVVDQVTFVCHALYHVELAS